MTRGDTKRFWTSLFAPMAVALGVLGSVAGAAKPPAPPPPIGTIYYRSGDVYYGIKGDGTGLTTNVLPNWASLDPGFSANVPMVPCNLPQGSSTVHDRWWLTTLATEDTYDEFIGVDGVTYYDSPHRDLFAVRTNPANRSQLITVQLTDLFGIARIGHSSAWSNDSNEDGGSFVIAQAYDIRGTFVADESGTFYDAREQIAGTLRIPLTASDISDPGFLPLGPDVITPEEFDAMLLPEMSPRGSFSNEPQGLLSPDGLDYVTINMQQLVIADALSPFPSNLQVLWNGSSGAPRQPGAPEWSPDGQSVAFIDMSTSTFQGLTENGDLWVQGTGSGAPRKVLGVSTKAGTTFVYSSPVWSPDSKYVAVLKYEIRSGNVSRMSLLRVFVADGTSTELTAIPYLQYSFRSPLRWTRNN